MKWTVRKTINGKQVQIGRFATYEEAIAFLADYNKNPYIYSPSQVTFGELYQLMRAERYPKLASSTRSNYEAAYKHCAALYNKRFADLRISDLQGCIKAMSAAGVGYASQKKCRQLLHHVYSYAVKYEFISPSADITRYIEIEKRRIVYPKKPFNTRQLNRVRALIEQQHELAPWAMCVVMMCYSGVRPSEFLAITKADVKLRQRFFVVRESKTEAGRNRLVPISRKTLPFFEYWLALPSKTLITSDGKPLTYHQFRAHFGKVMAAAKCKHTPHECRHTTATNFNNKGANITSVKRILGHADKDVTTGVYTHKDIRQLKKAVDLL